MFLPARGCGGCPPPPPPPPGRLPCPHPLLSPLSPLLPALLRPPRLQGGVAIRVAGHMGAAAVVEWRPCGWWRTAVIARSGEEEWLCDGIGVARLLNTTVVLPKFEVAAYWNESRLEFMLKLRRTLLMRWRRKSHLRLTAANRKGILIMWKQCFQLSWSITIFQTPAMSQRRDRNPSYAKASYCQGCYNALQLIKKVEVKSYCASPSHTKTFLIPSLEI